MDFPLLSFEDSSRGTREKMAHPTSKIPSLCLQSLPATDTSAWSPSNYLQPSPVSESSLYSPAFDDSASGSIFEDSFSSAVEWNNNTFNPNNSPISTHETYVSFPLLENNLNLDSPSSALFPPLDFSGIYSHQISDNEENDKLYSPTTFSAPIYPDPENSSNIYKPSPHSSPEPEPQNDRRKRTKFSSAQNTGRRSPSSTTSSSASSPAPPPRNSRKGRLNHNLTEKRYRSRLNGQFETLLSVLPSTLVNGADDGDGVGEGEGAGEGGEGKGKRGNVSKAEVLILAKAHIEMMEKKRRVLEKRNRGLKTEVERWKRIWEGGETKGKKLGR